MGSVGVTISTHNRRPVFNRTVRQWQSHMPRETVLVVVDDGSDVPVPDIPGATVIRHDKAQGVAATKNAGMAALMEAGCEHLLLVDDDCWPRRPGLAEHYIQTGYKHLCYLWPDASKQKGVSAHVVYDDGQVIARAWPRGVLMYMHRSVVEQIGGYRTEFGVWGGEHVEYSLRAWSAGLIPYPFLDAKHSDRYVWAADEHGHHHRSVPAKVREEQLPKAFELIAQHRGSTDFVEYRDWPNLAVTFLFTKRPDPQRGTRLPPDPNLVAEWRASLRGCEPVVLHDEIATDDPVFVKVPTGINVYLQRWVSVFRYLQDTKAKWVWMTDGTDVVMRHEPWDHMRAGSLYVGWEPSNLGESSWLRQHHPQYGDWILRNKGLPMYNAGVVGGDLTTMREFTAAMCWEISNREHNVGAAGDMAAFNYVCHRPPWRDRIVTGYRVTSKFKAYETDTPAWFSHK